MVIIELMEQKERIRQAKERAKQRKKRHDATVAVYRQWVFAEGDNKYVAMLELAGSRNEQSIE